MKYELFFPTELTQINPENDNLDVCLKLENREQYSLVVATPENLKVLMQQENKPYLKPGAPMLFVEKLTSENIRQLVEDLLSEDREYLKVYGTDFL